MFSYIVCGLAILLFSYNPIIEFIAPDAAAPKILKTPRPAINESLLALDGADTPPPVCGVDAYSIHILNKAPLVVYVENFVSAVERRHLLNIRWVYRFQSHSLLHYAISP